jgi:hypothetical protein
MRLYLGSFGRLYEEFPDLVDRAKHYSVSLHPGLVADLKERAGPAFEGWHVGPMGEQEIRASVGIALLLAAIEHEMLPDLTIGSLYELAMETPGLQENHVIGAALFGKPVAGPGWDPEDVPGTRAADADLPGGVDLQALLETDLGQQLLALLAELLRRGNGPGAGPTV